MTGKVRTGLAIAEALARSPRALTRVVDHGTNERSRRYVRRMYGFDAGLPQVDLIDLMSESRETIFPYSYLEGQASVPDLILLKSLARQKPGCRFLEIGTWRGESLASVASVASRCVSISLSVDEMQALGLTSEFIETHGFFARGLENVTHIMHDSQTFDFSSLNETFDLVFIDGDHSKTAVENDTRNVFSVLDGEDSTILWHDYAYTPEEVRWDVLAGILDGCPRWATAHLYHVSNTQCAIFTREKLSAKTWPRFASPRTVFRVTVEASRI